MVKHYKQGVTLEFIISRVLERGIWIRMLVNLVVKGFARTYRLTNPNRFIRYKLYIIDLTSLLDSFRTTYRSDGLNFKISKLSEKKIKKISKIRKACSFTIRMGVLAGIKMEIFASAVILVVYIFQFSW